MRKNTRVGVIFCLVFFAVLWLISFTRHDETTKTLPQCRTNNFSLVTIPPSTIGKFFTISVQLAVSPLASKPFLQTAPTPISTCQPIFPTSRSGWHPSNMSYTSYYLVLVRMDVLFVSDSMINLRFSVFPFNSYLSSLYKVYRRYRHLHRYYDRR